MLFKCYPQNNLFLWINLYCINYVENRVYKWEKKILIHQKMSYLSANLRYFCLTAGNFSYKIKYAIFLKKKEVHFHEDDISA